MIASPSQRTLSTAIGIEHLDVHSGQCDDAAAKQPAEMR